MQLKASANLSSTPFNRDTTSGNFSNARPQLSSWVLLGHGLDAKDTFGFAIDLEGQLAAVQLEDRQIIGRSLDAHFPFGRSLGAGAISRAATVSQDRPDRLEVQWCAAAVDQRLKHLVQMPAQLEDQVATVFDLIAGVLIAEPPALLLVEVEREAQAAVDPTLADLAQSPYSPRLGQGVCDLRQACGVGDRRKAVSFLVKAEACLARLTGDVFVAVQHQLRGERRMPADLDRQVAPVGG